MPLSSGESQRLAPPPERDPRPKERDPPPNSWGGCFHVYSGRELGGGGQGGGGRGGGGGGGHAAVACEERLVCGVGVSVAVGGGAAGWELSAYAPASSGVLVRVKYVYLLY